MDLRHSEVKCLGYISGTSSDSPDFTVFLELFWLHLQLGPSGPRDHACPQAAHKWLCFVPEMSREMSIL